MQQSFTASNDAQSSHAWYHHGKLVGRSMSTALGEIHYPLLDKYTMVKIILFPSLMSRYARLIVLSKNNTEISKIIDGIEILSELGIFNPPDQFWPLLTKLVEKKDSLISLEQKIHTRKQAQTLSESKRAVSIDLTIV